MLPGLFFRPIQLIALGCHSSGAWISSQALVVELARTVVIENVL